MFAITKQPDCDGDGAPDLCESNCNQNCYPDDCDLAGGTSSDCDSNAIPDECDPDCNTNAVPDACDITSGTSHDCNTNGYPDDCDLTSGTSLDCNSNAIPDECDIADAVSQDAVGAGCAGLTNGIPDECDCQLPIANVVSVVTRKFHNNGPGNQDIPVYPGSVKSEPRWRTAAGGQNSVGAITQLRVTFDTPPSGPGSNPVTIKQATCAAPTFVPYDGASGTSPSIVGNELVLVFSSGLENARTYRVRVNTSITRVASQTFDVRCLKADVNGNGQVNATDRSIVVGVWTGSGYSKETDINLDGATNTTDRSIVVDVWTSPSSLSCAP